MAKTYKTIQERMLAEQMKDEKRTYYYNRINQFWTIAKRFALIGMLGYGAHWGYKNQHSVKSFLKSHSAPIQEVGKDFAEGVGMIRDTFETEKNARQVEEYHKIRKKNIKDYQKLGVDPNFKYAESGTKEYDETLQYYRESGVFKRD